MSRKMTGKLRKPEDYGDIINLERPYSAKHSRMSMSDRAAQFSPFAALTGYESCIEKANQIMEESQRYIPVKDTDYGE